MELSSGNKNVPFGCFHQFNLEDCIAFRAMPAHNHARKSSKELSLDPSVPQSGCIMRRDTPKLKQDIADYVDIMAKKTRDGDGCIQSDLLENMYELFKSAFVSAARRSSNFTIQHGDKVESEPIAIEHSVVKRLMSKIGEAVIKALGDSDRCISQSKVASLKERINHLIDHPPAMPPGQALANYRKFVEAKFSNLKDLPPGPPQ